MTSSTPLSAYEAIKRKRDGHPLPGETIASLIASYTRGQLPDYQMTALCMAIFFRGLSPPELSSWTQAMLNSGEVLDLSDIPGRKVDKHSTGGVGDKVSLSLAPLCASCGVKVPMISGRGLGHTGGTLDKLESIPGFRVDLSVSDYRRLLGEVGACLIGQTQSLCPADKKLYALRDVTATVECIPLIASSIMSKKLAEGIDALVLDVKVGSGAFMKQVADARVLAQTMMGIGRGMGRKVVALLTDMDQPLGDAVGNALEVEEAVAMLRGQGPDDYREVTLALSSEMLLLGEVAQSQEEARRMLQEAIDSGRAIEKLRQIVRAQGGDARALDDAALLPRAKSVSELKSPRAGYIQSIDTEEVGLAAVALGAGRDRVDAKVDAAVGFTLLKKRGARVEAGEPLLRIHYNDASRLKAVEERMTRAFHIGDSAPVPKPLVLERMA